MPRSRIMLPLLREENNGKLDLPNRDCDTGGETRPGEYVLADKTYAQLIDKLTTKGPNSLSVALRNNLIEFYSDSSAPIATKKNAKAWRKLQDQLDTLKQLAAAQSRQQPAETE